MIDNFLQFALCDGVNNKRLLKPQEIDSAWKSEHNLVHSFKSVAIKKKLQYVVASRI